MKNFKPSIFISVVLIFTSTYLFYLGLGVGREGGNWGPYFLIFLFSLFLNLVYYVYYGWQKNPNFGKRFTTLYIPWAFIIFIFFTWVMTFRPWIKHVSLDFGPSPLTWDSDLREVGFSRHALGGGKGMYGAVNFTIWEKEFWSENARAEYKLAQIKELQVRRRSFLVDHIGYEFKGWSTARIRAAFGEPVKIVQMDQGLEKWIYDPWTDHPDWEMPVYVKNGILYKVGD